MAVKNWDAILEHAAAIVSSYSTRVTLRQLFYRLVADQTLRNTRSEYGSLSKHTARARREGWFPELMDRTRDIERWHPLFQSTEEGYGWLKENYRRDRTEGQEFSVYLAVEKAGIVNQLWQWFGAKYGIPILPLGGYSSQSFVDVVKEDATGYSAHYANQIDEGSGTRPTVLIYGGDFDPSGEDIDRDFEQRTDCWDHVIRVALLPDQIDEFNLPPAMGKATDSRAGAFVARHGKLVQVEIDALPPDTLRGLYEDAIMEYWDMAQWESVMKLEESERDSIGS